MRWVYVDGHYVDSFYVNSHLSRVLINVEMLTLMLTVVYIALY
jgi:hypothetical protein